MDRTWNSRPRPTSLTASSVALGNTLSDRQRRMVSKYRNVFLSAFFRPTRREWREAFRRKCPGSITCPRLVRCSFRIATERLCIPQSSFRNCVSFTFETGSEINSHALFRNKASNKNASEPWMFNNLLKTRKFGSGSSYAFK